MVLEVVSVKKSSLSDYIAMDARLSATRMPLLFARYVAGQITEASWRAFSDVIDALDASSEERIALMAFFNDAIEDLGVDAVKLPRPKEAETVVATARWAA
jgi:hypothetical protein